MACAVCAELVREASAPAWLTVMHIYSQRAAVYSVIALCDLDRSTASLMSNSCVIDGWHGECMRASKIIEFRTDLSAFSSDRSEHQFTRIVMQRCAAEKTGRDNALPPVLRQRCESPVVRDPGRIVVADTTAVVFGRGIAPNLSEFHTEPSVFGSVLLKHIQWVVGFDRTDGSPGKAPRSARR